MAIQKILANFLERKNQLYEQGADHSCTVKSLVKLNFGVLGAQKIISIRVEYD